MKLPWLILAVVAILALVVGVSYVSASNTEVRLRNQFNARQEANKATFDNMWKTISQSVQVTTAQKDALLQIFTQHAAARTGNGGGGEVMKWVQESVPNVDTSVYKNLQNIITSARESFTENQVMLLGIKQAHDNVLDTFPSSLFVGSRPRLVATLVTSDKTTAAFAAGSDNDVELFKAK